MKLARQEQASGGTQARARGVVRPAEAQPAATAKAAEPAATSVAAAPPADERRGRTRRAAAPDRAFAPLSLSLDPGKWLPRSWPVFSGTLAASTLAAAAMTGTWPGVLVVLALVAAFAVSLATSYIERIDTKQRPLLHSLASIGVALVPGALFGAGIAGWAEHHGLPWEAALAMLVMTGATLAVYLRRQPAIVLAAQWALWATTVTVAQASFGVAGLSAAAVIALIAGREQLAAQQREERIRAAQERAQNRARDILSDYEDTGQGWFFETDRRSQITYVSETVARTLGQSVDKLVGKPVVQLFDLSDAGEANERTLMFHLSTRSSFKELPVRAAVSGEDRWWSISGRPIYDSYDNFIGFRGSGSDLTERKRSQEEVSRLANFDSLTGLANRFQISRALDKVLNHPQLENRRCAVFLLDLDRFKHVNDTMGHPAGDALLKQVARRLERAVGQAGQVGRLGGDEFKVLLPGRQSRQALADLARQIIHSLSQPYLIEGQRVVIGASVGIAMAPENGETADNLVRNADLALYAAKDGGRGRYHFYAEDLHAEAEARSQMEEDLRDAITKGDLELYYQPVVSMETEKITGFEALLRWHHPVKGWIAPTRFIGIAEDTGMIVQLGEWALRTACNDLARMPEQVRVAVNVSPMQFANPNLPAVVTQAIAQAGIRPDQLELEITESVFLTDDAGTDAMFKSLKNIGVRLALDDFGTGYSSLGYLKKAPFDKIKIDQSFVRGATQEGSRNGAIIASITSLAQALGMETTAEGVETLDELDLVRQQGCSHVQGFIYERPLDAETARARLASGLAAVARGPRAARAPRQTMLRKIVLEHGSNLYDGTIRNISVTGAMIEGVWHVPVGTVFRVQISRGFVVSCTVRWSIDDRMGVEFSDQLQRDANGRLLAVQGNAPLPAAKQLEKRAARG